MLLRRSPFCAATAFALSQLCAAVAGAQPAGQTEQPAAQADQPAAEAGKTPKKTAEEEIVVTGSRIRRKDLTTPAPITLINKEQIQASGKVSIGDFLQSLPEQGNAINTAINAGGDGSTRVSLRGLGAARTLVLLNGRRYVPGGNGADSSVDLNSIPSAAIERVEVLKDGASAIYGSDAIAGVINLITRKRYNGAEVSGYTGTSGHADGTIYDLNATVGASGERGNFIFTGGYYQQTTVLSGNRDFSSSLHIYNPALGGVVSQGETIVPAGTIVLPACPQRGPVPGCVGATYNASTDPVLGPKIDFYNRLVTAYPNKDVFIRTSAKDPKGAVCDGSGNCWRPFTDARLSPTGDGWNGIPNLYRITPQQRISLFSTGDTRIGSSTRGYIEANYVNRQSSQRLEPVGFASDSERISISKDNLYNPFGRDFNAAGSSVGAVWKMMLESGNRTFTQDIDTFRLVGGADGTLPGKAGLLKGWFWDTGISFARIQSSNTNVGKLKRTGLASALGPSMMIDGQPRCVGNAGVASSVIADCVPLNLFGGENSITPDQMAGLTFTGNQRGINQMTAVQFNLSGELFNLLAARPVGLAAGYEYRFLTGENIPDPLMVAGESTGAKSDITRGHYYVNEGFGELSIPIAGNMQFVEHLEASAAARVFNYSTFGTDVTYKFGGRWTLGPDFTIRGTYSTGFRAPSIADFYSGQFDGFARVQDPCGGLGVAGGGTPPQSCGAAANNGDLQTQVRSRVGGNPTLRPEKAKMYTAGVVIEPRWVRNLSLTADYYNISIDQSIGVIGAATILSGCYPADESGLAPNQAYCNLIQRDPNTQKIVNIINVQQNVGSDKTAGIDFGVQYLLPTEVGRFNFIFNGTWLQRFNRTLPDGTVVVGKDTYDLGVYPAFKFISSVRWGYRGWGAGISTRFLSGYKECGTTSAANPNSSNFAGSGLCYRLPEDQRDDGIHSRSVGAFNTYDVFLTYELPTSLGRTSFAVGVNNVFDRPPVFVYNGAAGANPMALAYADGIIGRFFYGRIGHAL